MLYSRTIISTASLVLPYGFTGMHAWDSSTGEGPGSPYTDAVEDTTMRSTPAPYMASRRNWVPVTLFL